MLIMIVQMVKQTPNIIQSIIVITLLPLIKQQNFSNIEWGTFSPLSSFFSENQYFLFGQLRSLKVFLWTDHKLVVCIGTHLLQVRLAPLTKLCLAEFWIRPLCTSSDFLFGLVASWIISVHVLGMNFHAAFWFWSSSWLPMLEYFTFFLANSSTLQRFHSLAQNLLGLSTHR